MVIYQAVDKKFLNLEPGEGGSVCWDVEVHQDRKTGRTNISGDLSITDCYKKITLEFYNSTSARFNKRIDKIDSLIDSLLSFRDALYKARDEKVQAIIKYRKEHKGERFKSKETSEVRED